jgi:hypothetical protein
MLRLHIGTAIWVYGIVPNTIGATDTNMNVRFTLDDDPRFADEFLHLPNITNVLDYDYKLYSRQGLANSEHSLVMTLAPGRDGVVLLFDYAIYT